MENKVHRIEWLDAAKGMAIILVVLGHSALPAYLNRFIFAFHMPFFFFASGFSSNFNKYTVNEYVVRKMTVLILPFIVYSICNLILQPYVSDLTYQEYWKRFIFEGWMGVPLWFIPVLFLSLVLVRFVYLIKNSLLFWVVAAFLPAVSSTMRAYGISVPWNLSVVPYASFLIILGNFGKRFIENLDIYSSIYKLLLLLFFLSITSVISYFWKLDMCWNDILPFFPLLVGAIVGTLFLSLLAMFIVSYIKPLKILLLGIGKETYLILAFSEITIVYLNYFFSLNSALKYFLLVLILYVIYLIKKRVIAIRDTVLNE